MCSGKELFVSPKFDPIDLGGPDEAHGRGGSSILGKKMRTRQGMQGLEK